ncbi:MAG: acetolactate synthase small subunit [Myxococcota bacterium]
MNHTHTLTLAVRPSHGALVRVLGLAERRGYPPHGVHARMDPEEQRMFIELHVPIDNRPLEQLVRQLNKLPDVLALHTHPPHTLSQSAHG